MMKKEHRYLIFLTLLFFAISLAGILRHELWLDEAHHWLLARDSASVSELIQNTRSEGHPLLWSLLLYNISLLTANPFWMQLLHIFISSAAVGIFLFKAPFSLLFKTLFIFGYFIIFEYNLISRNYILGLFFLFLACSVFKNRDQKFILLSLFLALASNIHLMFCIITIAFFVTLLAEHIAERKLKRDFVVGYFIFGVGMCSIFAQIRYTNAAWFLDPINTMPLYERLNTGFTSFFKGIVLLPDFRTLYFWNTNFIVNASRTIAAVLSVLIYFLPLFLFYKNRKTLFFVYISLIGTQVFFFVTQRAATRFHGITFITIIVALWMEHYYRNEPSKLKDFLSSLSLTLLRKPIIYGILLLHFGSGVYAYSMDYLYPFTSAKETVDFLKTEGLSRKEIVAVTCDGTIISVYLERKIWFLCNGSYESFCHWDSNCKISPENNLNLLAHFMQTHASAIFVSYYPLSDNLDPNRWMVLNKNVKFRFLKKFDVNMVHKTDYYVFEVLRTNFLQ